MARDYFLRRQNEICIDVPSAFNAKLREERDLNTLIGICKGILFDKIVTEAEIHSLDHWLKSHPDVLDSHLAYHLLERIQRIKQDGVVTDEERHDLQTFIEQAVGSDPKQETSCIAFADEPPPSVTIPDMKFCFTGKFLSGSRKWCEKEVLKRSGIIQDTVSGFTDFLVVGALASKDWKNTTSGIKISRALDLKNDWRIKIILEAKWLAAIDDTPTDEDKTEI